MKGKYIESEIDGYMCITNRKVENVYRIICNGTMDKGLYLNLFIITDFKTVVSAAVQPVN